MSRSSLLLLAAARSLVDAVPLTIVASLMASWFARVPAPFEMWVDTSAVVLFWATVGPLLPTVRARGIAATLTTAGTAVMAVSAVGGFAERNWLFAALAGALYGALVIWRGLAIAEGGASWRAAAFATLAATIALAVGALALSVKSALVVLTVAAGGAGATALSVARGTEETFAAPDGGEGRKRPASISAFVVGVGALAAAAALPSVGTLLATIAALVEPFARAILVLVVTPFVYVADALVRALLPLLRNVRVPIPRFFAPGTPGDEEATARLINLQAQAFLERVVVVLALIVIAVLVARVVLARIIVARPTAPVERESIAGARLVDLLRGLFARPAAARAPRPSGDDAHARIRRAYWDLLALAERVGEAWRSPWQTPREHLSTLSGSAWAAAVDVVAPFEESRYAERARLADADRAERALGQLERELTART